MSNLEIIFIAYILVSIVAYITRTYFDFKFLENQKKHREIELAVSRFIVNWETKVHNMVTDVNNFLDQQNKDKTTEVENE